MDLLRVTNLSKTYGDHIAVNNMSFSLREGKCVALLGPNGAGKTTTLKMLTGLLPPSSGHIGFSRMNAGEDLRQHIGFLPQRPAFYNWMTGQELLQYVGKLTHVPKKELSSRVDELLHRVGLEEAKNRRIGGYSGGMMQRLGLAQAMIHKPSLLILDEPVSALDPLGRKDVLAMLRELKKETTILFSTHVLHDAEGISDEILIINQGKLVISGGLPEIRAQYQEPVIIIHFERWDGLDDWLSFWQKHELVVDIMNTQLTFKLVVKDLEVAKKIILEDIVTRELPFYKFEVAQTTLEDLFMKVVGV